MDSTRLLTKIQFAHYTIISVKLTAWYTLGIKSHVAFS